MVKFNKADTAKFKELAGKLHDGKADTAKDKADLAKFLLIAGVERDSVNRLMSSSISTSEGKEIASAIGKSLDRGFRRDNISGGEANRIESVIDKATNATSTRSTSQESATITEPKRNPEPKRNTQPKRAESSTTSENNDLRQRGSGYIGKDERKDLFDAMERLSEGSYATDEKAADQAKVADTLYGLGVDNADELKQISATKEEWKNLYDDVEFYLTQWYKPHMNSKEAGKVENAIDQIANSPSPHSGKIARQYYAKDEKFVYRLGDDGSLQEASPREYMIRNTNLKVNDDGVYVNTSRHNLGMGGHGNYAIRGSNGGDSLTGGAGNDSIHGSAGNDILIGGGGLNKLNGGAGNDALYGTYDSNVMIGGTGADTFVLSNSNKNTNIIRDLNLKEGDRLVIRQGSESRARQIYEAYKDSPEAIAKYISGVSAIDLANAQVTVSKNGTDIVVSQKPAQSGGGKLADNNSDMQKALEQYAEAKDQPLEGDPKLVGEQQSDPDIAKMV